MKPAAIAVGLGIVVAAGSQWAAARAKPAPIVLGRFATMLVGRTPGQKHNAKLAANKLDGCVIKPGQTFSFNQVVGSWSRDQGFVKAPVSFSGQLIPAYGGGVCQTSTTLYNAALIAGLEIVERKRHEFAPTYVTPGRDAAVAYQSVDLRLKNPYAHSVVIRASEGNGVLSAEIIGNAADRPNVEVSTEFLGSAPPKTINIGPVQHSNRIRNSGKAGFEVVVWRHNRLGREFISHDVYPPMHRLIEGGD